MATKLELIHQIKGHKAEIPKLQALLTEIPKEIKQLKATIKLKKKAVAEIEEKEKQKG